MSAPRNATPKNAKPTPRRAGSPRPEPATSATLFSDHSSAPPIPRISAVDADPRDPNLRRVKVGRRTVAVLPATAAEAHGLVIDLPWTEPLAKAVAHDAAVAIAREKALRSLGRSAATSARLIERLVRSGQDPAVASEAVASLRRDGWLDERATADALAESEQRRGRLPRAALARRLQAKGVETPLADSISAARGAASAAAEREACVAFATSLMKRSGSGSGASRAVVARRVAAGLARRGFDADIIARTLETLRLPTGDE